MIPPEIESLVGACVGLVIFGVVYGIGITLGFSPFVFLPLLVAVVVMLAVLVVAWDVGLLKRRLTREVNDLEERRRRDYNALEKSISITDKTLEVFIKEARGYLEQIPELNTPEEDGPVTRKERIQEHIEDIYHKLEVLEGVLDEDEEETPKG